MHLLAQAVFPAVQVSETALRCALTLASQFWAVLVEPQLTQLHLNKPELPEANEVWSAQREFDLRLCLSCEGSPACHVQDDKLDTHVHYKARHVVTRRKDSDLLQASSEVTPLPSTFQAAGGSRSADANGANSFRSSGGLEFISAT